MVAVPSMSTTRQDGGLGSIADSLAGRFAVAGIASSGVYTPQIKTTLAALLAEYTSGPMVDAAAAILARVGWVLCQRVASAANGSRSNVVPSGSGGADDDLTAAGGNSSAAVPTLSGTPTSAVVNIKLKVTIAGANFAAATARYQYSLDGGLTWSSNQTPSGSAAALGASGVSVTWADGSFVANDTWSGFSVLDSQQGTCTLAVTGNPNDEYAVVLEILRAGATLAAGTATYRLSLDGGDTWGPETAMPVSGIITPAGTGLTLTFTYSSGTAFAVGDRWSMLTTAPTFNSSGMAAAYEALDTGDEDFEAILWTGAWDASLCTALETLAEASEAALRYRVSFVGVRDQTAEETLAAWEAAIKTDFLTWTGAWVVPCAGHAETYSPATGRYNRRSCAVTVAARACSVPISEDLAWVERGALPGLTAIYYDGALNPALNDAGFTTLRYRRTRTFKGFFVVNPHTGAQPTSDFKLLQYLRVWAEAARVLNDAMTPHLSRKLRTVPKPLPSPLPPVFAGATAGAIDEREARAIEAKANASLRAVLMEGPVAHVTSVSMRVARTTDVVATRRLDTTLSLGPMGYAKSITNTIGFALGGAS